MDYLILTLEQLPKSFKITILIILLYWMIPIEMQDWFNDKVDMRIHAALTPMKEARDKELATMKEDIRETKVFTKEIAIHLMGSDRVNRMVVTKDDK